MKEVITLEKEKRRHHPLSKKILVPLLAVLVVQSSLFFFATAFGGVSSTLNQNARDILTERVINKRSELETKFTSQWTNFSTPKAEIQELYNSLNTPTHEQIYESADSQKELLAQSVPSLIKMLRSNEVTGVFLILNDNKDFVPLKSGSSQEKYGICIRDYSPLSEYTGNEDLLVARCPSSVHQAINCSLETFWNAFFTFNDTTPGDYFYKPLEQAYQHPDIDSSDLAYLSDVHTFGENDRPVISYSIPLISEDGYPYGVLGVELTTDYLATLLPAPSLYGVTGGCYALVRYRDGEDTYHTVTYSGVLYQQCFGNETSFPGTPGNDGLIHCDQTNIHSPLSGSLSNLTIYNHNTPFESERLALMGIVQDKSLYGISHSVENRILVVSIIVLLIGSIAFLAVSKKITDPVKKLSKKVRNMDGSASVVLDRLNIDEIDDLVSSIEELNDKVNKNLTRTEFFSRMSHDMRTPMNAIIGFSAPEIIESVTLPQAIDYLDKIHTSGEYLLSLINDVLDMTKIESQRMEIREEVLSTNDVLRDIVPIITEVSKEKHINLIIDVPEHALLYYGDRQRLSQIFMNLLSNAVKFTQEYGTVRFEAKELAKNNTHVSYQVIIEDTGKGMSKEFQKKMYEPFSQDESSKGGTGLGLAIANQMVKLMGGSIDCESEPEKGTKFIIRLTHRLSEQSTREKMNTPAEIKHSLEVSEAMSGKHVLLCEDHPLNTQIATRLLERKGIIVDHAENGEEGLKKFEEAAPNTYQLILMDIRMPVLNGLEASKAIRAVDRPDAKTIPIIAMTANAFSEDVAASKAAGMNEHLSKPIDPTILYVTLEKYLSN